MVQILPLWACDRVFLVEIESVPSEFVKFFCRAPQVSIERPRHFLIYDNDITQALKSNLLLHADHSCLMH